MLSTGDPHLNCNTRSAVPDSSVERTSLPSPTESGVDLSSPSVADSDAALKFFSLTAFDCKTVDCRNNRFAIPDGNLPFMNMITDLDLQGIHSVKNFFTVGDSETLVEGGQLNFSEPDANRDCFLTSTGVQAIASNTETDSGSSSLMELGNVDRLFDLLDGQKSGDSVELDGTESPFSFSDLGCAEEMSLFPLIARNDMSAADSQDSEFALTNFSQLSCDRLAVDDSFCNYLTRTTTSKISAYLRRLEQIDRNLEHTSVEFIPELPLRSKRVSKGETKKSRKQFAESKIATRGISVCEKTITAVPSVEYPGVGLPVVSKPDVSLPTVSQPDLTAYSLNRKATSRLKTVVLGSGYVGEFAKFVQLNSNGKRRSGCKVKSKNASERRPNTSVVDSPVAAERRPNTSEVDSPVATGHTRRAVRKRDCACCSNTDLTCKRLRTGKKLNRLKQEFSKTGQKNAADSKFSNITATCERLQSVQSRVYHLLRVLFPSVSKLTSITPHCRSLETLIEKITDILTDKSLKRKTKQRRKCCPVVSICSSPDRCLKSLRRKTIKLIQLILPSVCLKCTKPEELELIVDRLIAANETNNVSLSAATR